MQYNLPILIRAKLKVQEWRVAGRDYGEQPVLTKLDTTRDLGGSFYAPGNWREKHHELRQALEGQFGTPFKDNGNSFNSCFQFEASKSIENLWLRVKYYCKILALAQSETV